MPMRCRVCCHVDRADIEASLLRGEPVRAIAGRHGVSRQAVARHGDAHLPAALARAANVREITSADSLLDVLRQAASDAKRLAARAEAEGDLRAAIAGIKTIADVVATLATVAEKLAKVDEDGKPREIRLAWLDESEAEPFTREVSPVRVEASPEAPEERRRPEAVRALPPPLPPQEIPWNVNELPIRRSDGGRSL